MADAEKDLHGGHRKRVRYRFLNSGFDQFEDHQILEMLLFYALPRMDTNELAHRLINHFGSLSGVFDASVEELTSVKGVAENTAVLLKMIPPLARVYLTDKQQSHPVFDSPQKIGEYLVERFVGRTNETVLLLCMDSSLRLLSCELIAEGNNTSAHVDMKKVVERAIRRNASCVILAHNHPRGLALPSNEDILLTREAKRTLSALEITLLDHVIVADGLWFSIAQKYPEL